MKQNVVGSLYDAEEVGIDWATGSEPGLRGSNANKAKSEYEKLSI